MLKRLGLLALFSLGGAVGGNLLASLQDLDGRIALHPDDASLLIERGAAYFHSGKYEAALADIAAYIAREPADPLGYTCRGTILHNILDDSAGALADFNTALRFDPEYAPALYNRGVVLHNQDDFEASVSDFTRVLELDPTDGDALFARGNSHKDRGDFENATRDLRLAAQLNPDLDPQVRELIAEIERNTERADSDSAVATD